MGIVSVYHTAKHPSHRGMREALLQFKDLVLLIIEKGKKIRK